MAISSSKEFIVFPNDSSARVSVNEAVFTANGSWTAPTGITSAQVILVGGGGGGGGGSSAVAGGGGGGGQVIVKNVTVVPGTNYAINIGAGGQGGQGSILTATDVTNTLPGVNGGSTTFGTLTVANLLPNSLFDYAPAQWDSNLLFRQIIGVSGQTTVSVTPNATGIVPGMSLTTIAGAAITGLAVSPNNIVVSVAGNIVTLGGANTAAVNAMAAFDYNDSVVRPSTILYQNISSGNGALTSNPQLVGSAASPQFTNLSNNLLMPQVAQLEEPGTTTIAGTLVRSFGTNAATLAINSSGLPSKLAEMSAPYTRTISAASGATVITVSDTTNILPNMLLVGTSIPVGTVVLSVDSASQVTVSAATTAAISGATATFTYTGGTGAYALSATTAGAVTAVNPTWVSFSSINNTTSVSDASGQSTAAGTRGVPYLPGATYTFSVYVSTNVDIASVTPIKFQLRSTGGSFAAQSNQAYAGGTNTGTTSSIDAGTANGFFVREVTPTAAMPGYGGTITATTAAEAASGATNISLNTTGSGVLKGMSITGTGIPANTTISSVTVGATTTVTISAATTAVVPVGSTLTLTTPSSLQVLSANTTTGQNGWRRISATFTTPTIGTATANSQYAFGATPQFVYPSIVLHQGGVTYWFDNAQLEIGATATQWMPPMIAESSSAIVQTNAATLGNLETSHRFVRASAGTQYSASAFVIAGGSASTYRPFLAYLEFFDADYNSLARSTGTNTFAPIFGVATANQFVVGSNYAASHPVRVGVTATAPVSTAFVKFGVFQLNGAQSATPTVSEFHIVAPQLEIGATATTVKEPSASIVWAGAPGNSPLISQTGAFVIAEGGGGGGTYNSNNIHWQYGLQGGNNGGHAAFNSTATLPTLAGGGGGSNGAGMNAVQYMASPSNSTTMAYASGWNTSGGSSVATFPMRGNLGGYAVWNTTAAGSIASAPAYAGDGGAGVWPTGLNGNHAGMALGGGGGGAGWTAHSQNQLVPGRGNGGGGKGGGTYLVQIGGGTADYYARGIDGMPNTGGGGGGGSTNLANAPTASVTHFLAGRAVNYENAGADLTKWYSVYNAAIQLSAQAGFYSSNVLRATMQDVGNAKLSTSWQGYAVLPRTPLLFTGVAARLTTATVGLTSTQFNVTKRVRPTVRWRRADGGLIREERPPFDIIFTATNTVTYLGQATATSSAWQTQPAPANAAYFDITWELLYMDGTDVVDLDISDIQYFPYISTGGFGADGLALVRWFDKTTA